MRIVRNFAACPIECRGAAVALGNFDGVHLGHRVILDTAIAIAKANSVPSAVMTFEPHPREFFSKGNIQNKRGRLRISSFRSKIKLFADLGIDILFLVHFNEQVASLSPESFISDVLCGDLGVSHTITGYNFAFGKNRRGDTDFLEQQAHKFNFGFSACPAVYDKAGVPISSSSIREFLTNGNIKKASELLGRPYSIEGKVRHGSKNGRTLGFPTANLSLGTLFTPRYGVYAVRFSVEGQPDQWFDGVANLGIRPTFNQHEPLFEVHGFDMDKDFYGRRINVRLVDFLRDEQRFGNLEALKSQIALDCVHARGILQVNGNT